MSARCPRDVQLYNTIKALHGRVRIQCKNIHSFLKKKQNKSPVYLSKVLSVGRYTQSEPNQRRPRKPNENRTHNYSQAIKNVVTRSCRQVNKDINSIQTTTASVVRLLTITLPGTGPAKATICDPPFHVVDHQLSFEPLALAVY